MLEHQKKFFNRVAKTYHKRGINYLESYKTIRKVIGKYMNGKVMDVGNGGIIGYSLKNAKEITLVDISKNILKNPRRVVKNRLVPIDGIKVKTKVANVIDLPFESDSFNTVIMISTAHHLSESSLRKTKRNINKAISEIHKVLRKGGVFAFAECHPNFILKIIQDNLYWLSYPILSKFNKPQPLFLSRTEARSVLKNNGLEIIEESNIPSGKKVYVPLFPSISPPGWLWDKLIESRIYIARKT